MKPNQKYRVKAASGRWVNFDGIKKVQSNYNYTLELSDDNVLRCTANHRIVVGKTKSGKVIRRAFKLKVGDKVSNGSRITAISVNESNEAYYDLIGVDGNHLYTTPDGIEHHNCDEMAWVEDKKIKAFLDSAMPALSSGKDTKILFISTANGYNEFYKYASNAKALNETDIECSDTNGFGYREYDYTCVEGRDEEWFNKKVSEEGILSANRNYRVKFLGSGDTLVGADQLLDIKGGCIDPLDTYDLAHHDFKIFEYPIKGDPSIVYTIGVDSNKISATSASTVDHASVQVLKVDLTNRHITQVASLRTLDLHYTELAEIAYHIGSYYNDGWVMVENNSEGQGIVNDLQDVWDYPNIYSTSKRYDVLGFRTTKATRSVGVGNLRKLLRENIFTFYDHDVVMKELFNFVKNSKGKFEAQTADDTDDAIMAIIAALYWMQDNMNELDVTIHDFIDKTKDLSELKITENVGEEEEVAGFFFGGMS